MTSRPRDSFDDLPILAELRETLERRFDTDRSRRRASATALRRHVPVVLAASVAIAVVALALTLKGKGQVGATNGPGGPPGPALQQERGYISAAARSAKRSGACRGLATIPPVIHGAPSRALLAELGAFRRPAAAADRLPRSVQLIPIEPGVYVDYIRLARVVHGTAYYVVPTKPIASAASSSTSSCYAATAVAFHNELPHIPRRLRAPTASLFDRTMAAARRRMARGDEICLLFVTRTSTGGTCDGAGELQRTGMISEFGRVSGVVPDGVASVTVSYPARNGRPQTSTSDVVGNVFATSVPPRRPPDPLPSIVWRSPQGRVIKVIPGGGIRRTGSGFCSAPESSTC